MYEPGGELLVCLTVECLEEGTPKDTSMPTNSKPSTVLAVQRDTGRTSATSFLLRWASLPRGTLPQTLLHACLPIAECRFEGPYEGPRQV